MPEEKTPPARWLKLKFVLVVIDSKELEKKKKKKKDQPPPSNLYISVSGTRSRVMGSFDRFARELRDAAQRVDYFDDN